ncbi:MAG: amino acid permease [Naasia sp.]|nr:amino acid permease [Naasia sp.]
MLADVLQMISFAVPRRRFPTAARPYRSPVGISGAVATRVIALLIFLGFLLNPTFLPAIIAIAVLYLLGPIVFAVCGLHRDPQVETYGEAPLR